MRLAARDIRDLIESFKLKFPIGGSHTFQRRSVQDTLDVVRKNRDFPTDADGSPQVEVVGRLAEPPRERQTEAKHEPIRRRMGAGWYVEVKDVKVKAKNLLDPSNSLRDRLVLESLPHQIIQITKRLHVFLRDTRR